MLKTGVLLNNSFPLKAALYLRAKAPIEKTVRACDMLIRSVLPKTITFCALSLPAMAAMAQQFQQPLVIATGNWPSGVVAADLNGDGRTDLIYTDYGATPTASTTHILLSNGDGTFTVGQTILTAGTEIAVADFNHDGHPDLAWVWGTAGLGKAYLALGNGDGTFASAQKVGTFAILGTNAPLFRYVKGAQLHDTGYMDLLVEDAANPSLITLTSDENGILVKIVGTQLPNGVGPMMTSDLNGDGHADLVIQSVTGGVADVFLGSSDGLLTPSAVYAGSSAVQSMLLHDVDNDGHPDLVLEGIDGRIEIFHGNADGSFSTTSEGGSGNADATIGLGGHLIAVTCAVGQHIFYTATPAGLSVLLEKSDLSLTLGGIYNAGPGRVSFAVGDFNGDGALDVAVDSPEGIAILLGDADGSLGSSRAFAAGKPALSGVLGEFGGSNNLDAVVNVAASQALLLHGNGDGTFGAVATPTTSKVSTAPVPQVVNLPGAPLVAGLVQVTMVTEDLDGDGNQDVIVAYDHPGADHAHPKSAASNAIYIWYGNSDGGFDAPVVTTPLRNFYQLVAADVNGDGRPDLIMSDGYMVSVQNNLGGRVFGEEEHFLAGMGINSISAGDVNKDGYTDLVIANGGTVLANATIGLTTRASNGVTTGGITVLLNRIRTTAVPKIPTVVVFSLSTPSMIYFGQVVSGSARVTASDGSTPSGTISFFDGATNICTIAVTQAASCPPSAGTGFVVGMHTLTAAYSGDATHLGSTSAPVTVTVLPLATTTDTFNISVTGSSTTTVGGTVNLQVAVIPEAGSTKPVQLSCGDLPTEATCAFQTQTIPGGGGTTTMQLSVMPPRSCAVADSESRTASLPFASTTLAAFIVTLIPGKRRRAIKSLLAAVVAIFGIASITGCATCTDLGTKPGSYTIRVIGTEAGQVASIVTVKVKLTVKE
jgi:Bacterial Ig-like domain (group 3)/FG-GAP-like repeat/FG-GAP repeat